MNVKDKLRKIGYLSPKEKSLEIGVPKDYTEFIEIYSGQELHHILLLYSYPLYYDQIFGYSIAHLDGFYLFASDQSEYIYAFDSKNNWQIVEIDSSGEIIGIISKTFSEFISKKLDEIIEIEK